LFLLLDGDEVQVHSDYIYLARSDQNLPAIAFEFALRVDYAYGRLDNVDKQFVRDAAQQLLAPKVATF
jgi:hypothetical protein